MSAEIREKIVHFVDSTRDFERAVTSWAMAKIEILDLEGVLKVMERNGDMTAPQALESVRSRLEHAKKVRDKYEFQISEVIDHIAPYWKEILDYTE